MVQLNAGTEILLPVSVRSGLPVKCWPYVFFHVLRIRNALPHCGQNASPLFLTMGKKDNFTNLWTFSCRVFVCPPGFQKKHFKQDAQHGIFLGYVPHTDCLILYFEEGSGRVKIATHNKFDESFNDLPVDNMPLNCQKILCLNGTCICPDKRELNSSDLEFFLYPFSDKETAVIPVHPSTTHASFGFDLNDYDFSGCAYIKDVDDTVTSSAAKSFGTCKRLRTKLCGAFLTYINGDPVFSTAQACDKLQALFEQFLKANDQGVAANFLFKITFAPEDKLKGKQLKQAIDYCHFLLPGTTKRIKLKVTTTEPDENEVTLELDDRSDRFEIGMPLYKEFNKVEHKRKIIGYNLKHQLYEVEYEDGNKEEFYHNKIHGHKDCVKIAPTKSKKTIQIQVF